MSTKIYNGYKIPKFSLDGLDSFCHSIREKSRLVIKELSIELHARYATIFYDSLMFNLELPNECNLKNSPLHNACLYISKEQREIRKTGLRNPGFDFSFCFTMYVLSDKILCYVFTENKKLFSMWESFPEVSEYGYWNNTDIPEHVTELEWSQRKKDWELAVNRVFLNLSGFTVECYNKAYEYNYEDQHRLRNYISSIDYRIDNIAHRLARSKTNIEIKSSEIMNYFQSDQYKQSVITERKFVEQKINRELTLEDLLREP